MSENIIAENILTSKERSLYDFIVDIITLAPFRKSNPKVAILRLNGVIGKLGGIRGAGLTLESVNDKIEKAFSINKLTAICLVINSPGGSPVQAELIANRIIQLSKLKKIPVYSFVEDVAASGGYWLACAGEKIYASRSSIIGSIGVISSGFGMQEAIEKLGIERRVYTAGRNKAVLDPFLPVKEEDLELLKKIQLQIHAHFIEYIKERRIGKLTQEDDILFNGEFWPGIIALDYGLIDGIDDLYSFLLREFGDKLKIEYVTAKLPWLKRTLGIHAAEISAHLSSELKNLYQEIKVGSKYDYE